MNQNEFRSIIHQKILDHLDLLKEWFSDKNQGSTPPFYSSFDIRDSGFKMACVDANLFPAGFNNICKEDQNLAGNSIKEYLQKHHPSVKKFSFLQKNIQKIFTIGIMLLLFALLLRRLVIKLFYVCREKPLNPKQKLKQQ